MWIQCNPFNTHSFSPRNNSKTAVKNKQSDKTKFFITKPTFFSIELNAHNLTYLRLLVMNKQLPPESLNIYLFSSQSCEATFRNCRALSGTFSSATNFNVQEFIKRSEKLALLSEIKTYENLTKNDYHIRYPVHHKLHHEKKVLSLVNSDEQISMSIIEELINESYEVAKGFIEELDMSNILIENSSFELYELSENVSNKLTHTGRTTDYSQISEMDGINEEEESDIEVIADELTISHKDENEELNDGDEKDNNNDDNQNLPLTTARMAFSGMRIHDEVNAANKQAYFSIKVNNSVKYMHKQTACWYLMGDKNRLSSDRLLRVQQKQR
ncbi:unnamed protein product [Didymodactylos carnosus]|uniref:Uncharacterized protein n=1 Tax=Didymodactylos carnosus TaxID=1234261 RepID=A0A8S2RRW9_9BILA|nr:unnamed protein product [Didymodactylos carnosus]CAF4184228.1 unnamed protein product [Didymodactylos carnosus]